MNDEGLLPNDNPFNWLGIAASLAADCRADATAPLTMTCWKNRIGIVTRNAIGIPKLIKSCKKPHHLNLVFNLLYAARQLMKLKSTFSPFSRENRMLYHSTYETLRLMKSFNGFFTFILVISSCHILIVRLIESSAPFFRGQNAISNI